MNVIDYPIPPKKQQQWHWRIHPYFTKQASNVVREYIRNFTEEGDIVLDPFCGTGVTLIESLTLRRRAIGVDLDPLAVFITRETCIAPIDLEKFVIDFKKIEKEIMPLVDFSRSAFPHEIDSYEIKEWYPKGVQLPSNSDFDLVENLFDKRQLMIYAKLLSLIEAVNDEEISNLLKLVFSNTLGKANLTYMDNPVRGSEGGGPSIFGKYRYWRPKNSVIIDVWKNFSQRFNYTLKAKEQSNKIIGSYFKEARRDFFEENATFSIFKNSATSVAELLPPESIDYIYRPTIWGTHRLLRFINNVERVVKI